MSNLVQKAVSEQVARLFGWKKTSAIGTALSDCSLIIPTYRRPNELVQLLRLLSTLPDPPGEVLIIDGSPDDAVNEAIKCHFGECALAYDLVYVKSPAGLTRQRNVGIDVATRAFIFFLDDDCLPEPGYFTAIRRVFCEDERKEIGAVRGFLTNSIQETPTLLWRLRFALGIVPKGEPGLYHQSGTCGTWSGVKPLQGTQPVDVLAGGAAAYRREVFLNHRFSTFFYGYAQGEDLEMSLRLGRNWKMLLCWDARVDHRHAVGGRPPGFARGKMVVRNRYFIWKRYSPQPSVSHRLRFWGDHVLGAAYYVATFLIRPWRPYYLSYAMGTVVGVFACLIAPPSHTESPARREYIFESGQLDETSMALSA